MIVSRRYTDQLASSAWNTIGNLQSAICNLRSILCAVVAIAVVLPLHAQERSRGFRILPGKSGPDFSVNNVSYDGRLTWVRLRFTPSRTGYGGGGGYFGGINYQWDHDYPRADAQIITILDELTSIGANLDGTNIFAVTDEELSRFPIAYLAEPGWWTQTDEEVVALRNYLLKGGFLIVDDFAANHIWPFREQIRRVLPNARLVELDGHEDIFHSFFEIESLDYDHPYYGYKSVFFGIFEDNDPNKRLMVIVNYNNDIGEYWEWSSTGFIPIDLSNEGFKLGINYIVYAMTH